MPALAGRGPVNTLRLRAQPDQSTREHRDILDRLTAGDSDGVRQAFHDHRRRAAAEFNVAGTYLETDEGLPPASGQRYRLPAGTFFAVDGGLITRITTYYNLTDWLMQVTGEAEEGGLA